MLDHELRYTRAYQDKIFQLKEEFPFDTPKQRKELVEIAMAHARNVLTTLKSQPTSLQPLAMSQTESLATPTDTADVPKAKRAKKQRRFKLFSGENGGDFRIYIIAEDENFPKGTLIPAPSVQGFDSTQAAQKFIRTEGSQFIGKQLMVLKAIHIVRVNLEEKPQVKVEFKPRSQVSGPPKE